MTVLCKYKNAFGLPGQGIHSFRLFNFSIVDIIITIIGAYIISIFFKISFLYTTIGLFSLGIFVHRIFCVRTTIDKLLFP